MTSLVGVPAMTFPFCFVALTAYLLQGREGEREREKGGGKGGLSEVETDRCRDERRTTCVLLLCLALWRSSPCNRPCHSVSRFVLLHTTEVPHHIP
jgi:hypothetical protein